MKMEIPPVIHTITSTTEGMDIRKPVSLMKSVLIRNSQFRNILIINI